MFCVFLQKDQSYNVLLKTKTSENLFAAINSWLLDTVVEEELLVNFRCSFHITPRLVPWSMFSTSCSPGIIDTTVEKFTPVPGTTSGAPMVPLAGVLGVMSSRHHSHSSSLFTGLRNSSLLRETRLESRSGESEQGNISVETMCFKRYQVFETVRRAQSWP